MEEFTTIKYKRYDKDSVSVEVKDGVANIFGGDMKEKELKIDNRKAIKKWKPILEALKIYREEEGERIISDVDPYGEENWSDKEGGFEPLTIFASVYAEHHQLNNNSYSNSYSYLPGDIYMHPYGDPPIQSNDMGQNLLPMSMKILSQINLKDKNYEIRTGLSFKEISIKIDKQQMSDSKYIYGIDIIQKLESIIVQMLIDRINEELATKNTIYIECLADSLSLISEEDLNYMLILKSKYEIL